jgi:hypothetical protein
VAKKKTIEDTSKVVVRDSFQTVADQKIQEFGKKLEGKGKTIIYALLGVILIGILGFFIYNWQKNTGNAAQTALGKAIDVHNAQVTASPVPNNPELTFKTDKERAEKAIAAFQEVADKYGSPYREKALYFIAVNRLKLDREAGVKELTDLSGSGNREVATLAKFALAEAKFAESKYDEAANLYQELLNQNSGILPTDTINFALATVYEKQGKNAEAAGIYFNIAKAAREAKDADGKPMTLTTTAREAAQKLEKLDAAKFKELPPEPSAADL